MTERQKLLLNNAADVTDLVLEAEKWLWQHPQTGYTEWEAISGKAMLDFDYSRIETGSSDFGDITCVMPGIQMNAAGCSGTLHGIDFCVAEPERLCMNSIRFLLFITDELLADNAKKAADICAQFKYQFKSIPEYLKYIDEITLDKDAVIYSESGSAVLDYV